MSETGGFVGPVQGIIGAAGVLVGVLGTIIVALINRKTPLEVLVDARMRLLIESQQELIACLEAKVEHLEGKAAHLEGKVEALTKELHEARRAGC